MPGGTILSMFGTIIHYTYNYAHLNNFNEKQLSDMLVDLDWSMYMYMAESRL